MGTIFRIIKRDLIRLIKAPAALIVVAALIIIPSLYTWVNVYGFWNPYDNTANMRVCFVTEDKGGYNELTGELNLGDMIDETLRENNQLGWAFMSKDEALEEVQSGKAYAAFMVPEDFTDNLLTLFTSDFTKPQIQYYVNEKLGPVSPKVTDAGSTTLDETINSTFVETVSKTVAEKLNDAIYKTNDTLNSKEEKAVSKIEAARNALLNSRDSLTELGGSIDNARSNVQTSKAKLRDLHDGINRVESGLADVQKSTQAASEAINNYCDTTLPTINNSLTQLTDAATSANQAIQQLSVDVQTSQAAVNVAIEQNKIYLNEAKLMVEQLKQTAASLPDGAAKDTINTTITALGERITTLEKSNQNLQTVSNGISDMARSTANASTEINQSVRDSTNAALGFNKTMYQTTLPALSQTLSDISSTSGSLGAAVKNQHMLINQIDAVLNQLDTTLSAADKSIDATKNSLLSFDDQLEDIQTDVSSFAMSKMLEKIIAAGGLDSDAIGEFIASPTVIEQQSIYNLNAYGSAMAPLFMNLTFWIGAFMLLVILRQEVDSEGFEKLTITQRYISRWLLLMFFAILQAILCIFGVLALGVQTVNVYALFFISCLCSASYLSLMFMLSTTLQHIGKGVCVLLAFLQIPGATGLYPIEMTTPFFQEIYPYFPFTYGINGLRETICGFYGWTFWICVAVLLGILLVSLFIGIFLRPYLTNFNKLFAKQIREGGLYVGEEIEIPTQRFRLSQLVGYLSNREDYKQGLERRAKKFLRRYDKFKRYALFAGIALSVLIAVLFAQFPAEYKPNLLTIWLVGLIVLMLVLVAVEHTFDSIERQINLDTLTDDELRGLILARNDVGRTTSDVFTKQRSGKGHKLMKDTSLEIKQARKNKKKTANKISELHQITNEEPKKKKKNK